MQFEISSFLGGLVLGSLLTVALAFPRIGRIFARIAAVLFFIGGIGLIAWATGGLLLGSELTPFDLGQIAIADASDAIGWGTGLLAGGILTLVLSSLGR